MTGGFHLCMHLDERGFPCNRRTMRPLSMCSLHREKTGVLRTRPKRAEYQRTFRAKRRMEREAAGVIG